MPAKRPDYRADRLHHDFLTTLKDHLPSIDDFEDRIEKQLSMNYDINVCDIEDVEVLIEELYDATSEKDMKLLVRTKIESVEDHMVAFLNAAVREQSTTAVVSDQSIAAAVRDQSTAYAAVKSCLKAI